MAGGELTTAERVLEAVSNETDDEVLDLPPLYDYVAPDALNALTEEKANVAVSFTYVGYEVTVESDGTVGLADARRSLREESTAPGDD